jgi:hypothetical protein
MERDEGEESGGVWVELIRQTPMRDESRVWRRMPQP